MIKVTFKSMEGHTFRFKTKAINESEAIKKAEDKLYELMYDIYSYSLHSVEQI